MPRAGERAGPPAALRRPASCARVSRSSSRPASCSRQLGHFLRRGRGTRRPRAPGARAGGHGRPPPPARRPDRSPDRAPRSNAAYRPSRTLRWSGSAGGDPPHRAPEPGDPLSCLAAHPALGAHVDRGVWRQLEDEDLRVRRAVDAVTQVEQTGDPGVFRFRRLKRRWTARAAVRPRSSWARAVSAAERPGSRRFAPDAGRMPAFPGQIVLPRKLQAA